MQLWWRAYRLHLIQDGRHGCLVQLHEIRAIRAQKSSVAAIFFVTRRKIFGRNISERLELKPQ